MKILLVQLYSNGDCLYATAVARQIKKDFEGCQLTWAAAPFCCDLLRNNPLIDHIRVVDIPKSDVVEFRKFKQQVSKEKSEGLWDQVFITTGMDDNLQYYDGSIRGMILGGYKRTLSVPLQPVVVLSEKEIQNVQRFAEENNLSQFQHVILWEYAPQSGQSVLNFELVQNVAKKISSKHNCCFILSSASKFQSSKEIIDGSQLSYKENAALTHHCTLLIGCSSGITWLTTSTAARFLPMVQLLNPDTDFINLPSTDFSRYNVQHNGLIELGNFSEETIVQCIDTILTESFSAAEKKFHQLIPVQFKTSKKIVYNLLCYMHINAVVNHYRIMVRNYGKNPLLMKSIIEGVAGFPFKLMRNLIAKRFISR